MSSKPQAIQAKQSSADLLWILSGYHCWAQLFLIFLALWGAWRRELFHPPHRDSQPLPQPETQPLGQRVQLLLAGPDRCPPTSCRSPRAGCMYSQLPLSGTLWQSARAPGGCTGAAGDSADAAGSKGSSSSDIRGWSQMWGRNGTRQFGCCFCTAVKSTPGFQLIKKQLV